MTPSRASGLHGKAPSRGGNYLDESRRTRDAVLDARSPSTSVCPRVYRAVPYLPFASQSSRNAIQGAVVFAFYEP